MSTGARVTLILGPHRSGTSCVTEVVHKLGYELGRDVLGAHPCNPRGLWENEAVVSFNDLVLGAGGTAWFDHGFVDLGDLALDLKDWEQGLIEVFHAQFQDGFASGIPQKLVVKDPRICRLLPLYSRVFSRMGCDVRAVLVLRDPRESADSLYRRDGVPPEMGFGLWIAHMLGAVRWAQTERARVISYGELLGKGSTAFGELGDWLGETLPGDSNDGKALSDLVDPSLRRSDGHQLPPLSRDAKTLEALALEIFLALCHRTDARVDVPDLDAWTGRFRAQASGSRWLSRQRLVLMHQGVGAGLPAQSLLDVLEHRGVGLLVIRDGDCDRPIPTALSRLVAGARVGLFFNLIDRGEAASLVRGIGLTGGRDVLVLRAAGTPWLEKILDCISLNINPVVALGFLVREKPHQESATEKLHMLQALYLPATVVQAFDPWLHVPLGDDAWLSAIDGMRQAGAFRLVEIDDTSVR